MMRNLLILLALAAAQVGFYFWRLHPDQFQWDSLTGVSLATLTLIFWSAVLQIAWRDREEQPDSPREVPKLPGAWFPQKRAAIACCFVVLAIPATISTWIWAETNADDEVAQFCLAADLPIPDALFHHYGSPSGHTYTGFGLSLLEVNPITSDPKLQIETLDVTGGFSPVLFCEKRLSSLKLAARAPELLSEDKRDEFEAELLMAVKPGCMMLPAGYLRPTRYMVQPHPLIAKRQPKRETTSQGYDYDEDTYYTQAVGDLNDLQHPRALTLAIQRGDTERVQELLDAGADVHAVAPDAIRTPLEEAEMCGKQKIIELLKEAGAKPSPDA